MQINSSNNLITQYGLNQVEPRLMPEKGRQLQAPTPAREDKADSVSLSTEALRKQAETKKSAPAADQAAERVPQQQDQTAPASTKNMAAQRIDLIA